MIRTHILPCTIPRARADGLNRSSGIIYTGVLVAHWRTFRRKGIWLSETSGTRWSDSRTDARMHAHSIDVAQQGFYKACQTTRGLRKAGFTEAKFPHWTKKFRTTIWKNTGFKREGDTSNRPAGAGPRRNGTSEASKSRSPNACGMSCGSWRSASSTTRMLGGIHDTSWSRTA